MAFHDVSAVDPVGPDAAVVRALRAREAVLGPSEGVVVLVQQGVLLLDAKPRLEFLSPENSRLGLSTTDALRSRYSMILSLSLNLWHLGHIGLCNIV